MMTQLSRGMELTGVHGSLELPYQCQRRHLCSGGIKEQGAMVLGGRQEWKVAVKMTWLVAYILKRIA